MQNILDGPNESQPAGHSQPAGEINSARKVGVEIVLSAQLPGSFFHVRRGRSSSFSPDRHALSGDHDLPRPDRLAALRGQLTLLKHRCKAGLPVTVNALAGAERIARSLELEEIAYV